MAFLSRYGTDWAGLVKALRQASVDLAGKRLGAKIWEAIGAAAQKIEESGEELGLDEVGPINGRGLAPADFDNDGDMDAAVSAIGGPLVLLENQGAAGNWLEVATSSFSPGAVVTVLLEDGRELRRELHAGSSYLSSVDPRAHFGLGEATTVAEVRVAWPAGGETVVEGVDANQVLVLDQEKP